ncbi:MAG: helix-turn-helix transcriptional regulator [Bacilli bacterium]|jgi:transcriptional regulator with XRE-family HTH domain
MLSKKTQKAKEDRFFLYNASGTLRDERIKQKISAKDLARDCNISVSTIYRLERFETIPKLTTYFKIAMRLGLIKHKKFKAKIFN